MQKELSVQAREAKAAEKENAMTDHKEVKKVQAQTPHRQIQLGLQACTMTMDN